MKILIINDLFIKGGTETQCHREKEIAEENGNEVSLITFDSNFPKSHGKFNSKNRFYNFPIRTGNFAGVYRKLFYDPILCYRIRKLINKLKPDIIHANNLILAPCSQYKALEGYKVVQTVRDYSVVCIKGTSIFDDKSICQGYKYHNCRVECNEYSKFKSFFKVYRINKIEKLKKTYVKKFISPSETLRTYLINNSYENAVTINDCLDFSKFEHYKKNESTKKKRYVYFGAVNEIKGVFKLLDAFNEFSKDKDVELIIIGNIDKGYSERLYRYTAKNHSISCIGFQDFTHILEILKDTYAVVVPSLCMDNYPNTVLEAMAAECLVLGSNRGGIPEILEGRGLLFDVLNHNEMVKAINRSYFMSQAEYSGITKKAKKFIKENNNKDKYYKKIMDLFHI